MALNWSDRSHAYIKLVLFPSQVITVTLGKTIWNLSHIGSNYAGKAMVFSKQPYGKGQNAFNSCHKSLLKSFRIALNPFFTEQSQNTLRQQMFSQDYLFLSMHNYSTGEQNKQLWSEKPKTLRCTAIFSNRAHEEPKQYADRHWSLKELSVFYHKISLVGHLSVSFAPTNFSAQN